MICMTAYAIFLTEEEYELAQNIPGVEQTTKSISENGYGLYTIDKSIYGHIRLEMDLALAEDEDEYLEEIGENNDTQ